MNKIIKIFLVLIITIFSFNITNANNWWTSDSRIKDIKVQTTEKVPWANCTWSPWDYTCTVKTWFNSVTSLLWEMIKYITFIRVLRAVLFIVISWIMLSMSWADSSLKDEAKKRITQWIIWLILLLLSWVILNMIAPWIYK